MLAHTPHNQRQISCARTEHSRDFIAVPSEVQCTASNKDARMLVLTTDGNLKTYRPCHDCVFQLYEARLAANLIGQVPLPRYFFIHF